MKRKYKIVQVTKGDEQVYFPMWRYAWWPFWFYFHTTFTGHDWSVVSTATIHGAKEFISYNKKHYLPETKLHINL